MIRAGAAPRKGAAPALSLRVGSPPREGNSPAMDTMRRRHQHRLGASGRVESLLPSVDCACRLFHSRSASVSPFPSRSPFRGPTASRPRFYGERRRTVDVRHGPPPAARRPPPRVPRRCSRGWRSRPDTSAPLRATAGRATHASHRLATAGVGPRGLIRLADERIPALQGSGVPFVGSKVSERVLIEKQWSMTGPRCADERFDNQSRLGHCGLGGRAFCLSQGAPSCEGASGFSVTDRW